MSESRKQEEVSNERKPHPITRMAEPSIDDLQCTLVDLAFFLREAAGECERHLDNQNVETVDFSQVVPPMQLRALATSCAQLAATKELDAPPEAMEYFAAAATHFAAADAHLMSNNVYSAFAGLGADKHTTDMLDDERRYSARAVKAGRQSTHRGLSKLAEAWPHAYEMDDDVVDTVTT